MSIFDGEPKYNPDRTMVRADTTTPGDGIEIYPANDKPKDFSLRGWVKKITSKKGQSYVIVEKTAWPYDKVDTQGRDKTSIGGGTAIRVFKKSRKT